MTFRTSSRKRLPLSAAVAVAAALIGWGAPSASAQDVSAHFKGKTVTLVIPLRTGGTVDLIARYFAAEFGKFIPGNPRIVGRNVTPRIAGANYVYKSPPDGYTIGIISSVLYQDQYHQSADFDVAKFKYIGSTNTLEGAWFVQGKLPYKDITEARGGKTPIRVAVMPDPKSLTGFDFAPLLLADAFDLPLQAIPVSSTGLGRQLQMLERNEIDGINRGIVYYQLPRIRPGWVKNGTVKPFAFIGLPGVEMWSNLESDTKVPNVTDMIKDPKLKEAWDSTILPNLALWVPFYLPPETPEHIIEAYRAAFKAAMTDKAFREGYEKIEGIPSRPVWGAEAQKVVEQYAEESRRYQPKYEELATKLYKKYTDAYRKAR